MLIPYIFAPDKTFRYLTYQKQDSFVVSDSLNYFVVVTYTYWDYT